jgi:hypothetical protein
MEETALRDARSIRESFDSRLRLGENSLLPVVF